MAPYRPRHSSVRPGRSVPHPQLLFPSLSAAQNRILPVTLYLAIFKATASLAWHRTALQRVGSLIGDPLSRVSYILILSPGGVAEVTAAATAPTAAILNGDASASKLAVGGAAGAGISGSCRRLMPTSAEHSVPQQSTRQTTTQPFPAPESYIPPGAPHHRSAPTRDPANHQPQHTASLR